MGTDISLYEVPKATPLLAALAAHRISTDLRHGFLRYNSPYLDWLQRDFTGYVLWAIGNYEQGKIFPTENFPNIELENFKTCHYGLDWVLGIEKHDFQLYYDINLTTALHRVKFLQQIHKSPTLIYEVSKVALEEVAEEANRIHRDLLVFTPSDGKRYVVAWSE